jgi:hypothetical protein
MRLRNSALVENLIRNSFVISVAASFGSLVALPPLAHLAIKFQVPAFLAALLKRQLQ